MSGTSSADAGPARQRHVVPGLRQGQANVAMIALVTAGVVIVARQGTAFWLCVPGVLVVSAIPRTRQGIGLAAVVVTAAALIPIEVLHLHPLPPILLAFLVPASSAAVLTSVRERLEGQRDALRDVALSDPLTGIANRRLLLARAEYEIARHSREQRSFAVVMLDLDGFKLLNDRFGHAAGDELLCDVASALTHSIRAQDTAARLGGDEFCVLAPGTDRIGLPRLSNRIARAVAGATAGVEALRASSGIAVFPEDGQTAASLLHKADLRLLAAKRERYGDRTRRRAA